MMARGMIRMWMTNSRGMKSVPGKLPPNSSDAIHVPTSGIDRMI
jgi:hypothetical protein